MSHVGYKPYRALRNHINSLGYVCYHWPTRDGMAWIVGARPIPPNRDRYEVRVERGLDDDQDIMRGLVQIAEQIGVLLEE